MGLFDFFFSKRYPTAEHTLLEHDVRRLVTYLNIPSLRGEEQKERMLQQAILDRRHGDGKISLQQIYELLTKMKNNRTITVFERDQTMKVLQKYFQGHAPV